MLILASTAFDALTLNYRVVIIEDACRGVDKESIKRQKSSLINRGALIVDSKQVRLFSILIIFNTALTY